MSRAFHIFHSVCADFTFQLLLEIQRLTIPPDVAPYALRSAIIFVPSCREVLTGDEVTALELLTV